jgi:hypothetical protein
MDEAAVEVGTGVKAVDWLIVSSATQDPGFPALGGRVGVRVGVGMGAVEMSALPVAMYPTKAHINPKKICMTRGWDR